MGFARLHRASAHTFSQPWPLPGVRLSQDTGRRRPKPDDSVLPVLRQQTPSPQRRDVVRTLACRAHRRQACAAETRQAQPARARSVERPCARHTWRRAAGHARERAAVGRGMLPERIFLLDLRISEHGGRLLYDSLRPVHRSLALASRRCAPQGVGDESLCVGFVPGRRFVEEHRRGERDCGRRSREGRGEGRRQCAFAAEAPPSPPPF